jgi:hypothetical protein
MRTRLAPEGVEHASSTWKSEKASRSPWQTCRGSPWAPALNRLTQPYGGTCDLGACSEAAGVDAIIMDVEERSYDTGQRATCIVFANELSSRRTASFLGWIASSTTNFSALKASAQHTGLL